MMKRHLVTTKDGSHTLFVPELDEHYHSIHGSVYESQHVFIEMGLEEVQNDRINILEIGFGTGLNAFMTLLNATGKQINYTGYEAYPVKPNEVETLNYPVHLNAEEQAELFRLIHTSPWNEWVNIMPHFQLKKKEKPFQQLDELDEFDLVYYDAFAPSAQPELWTIEQFEKIYASMRDDAILVTYCAKGEVRRNLQSVGFTMEKLPGPPGKREMLRGRKL